MLIRGRDQDRSRPKAGKTITRFNTLERAGHWLLAVPFILLSLTGFNMLYGKYLLLPLIGKEGFRHGDFGSRQSISTITLPSPFMAGLVLIFVMWVVHNLPSRHDLVWLMKAWWHVLVKGVHPPAKKFNAGQKLIFWIVILGGLSLSLSGWALLFPFTTSAFADTFAVVNSVFGTSLPTDLSPLQEQQYNALWHTIMGIFMICVIIAHIYIGSIGMEGAFDAMGSGEVDLNWAKEHHSLWVDEVQAKASETGAGKSAQPAE